MHRYSCFLSFFCAFHFDSCFSFIFVVVVVVIAVASAFFRVTDAKQCIKRYTRYLIAQTHATNWFPMNAQIQLRWRLSIILCSTFSISSSLSLSLRVSSTSLFKRIHKHSLKSWNAWTLLAHVYKHTHTNVVLRSLKMIWCWALAMPLNTPYLQYELGNDRTRQRCMSHAHEYTFLKHSFFPLFLFHFNIESCLAKLLSILLVIAKPKEFRCDSFEAKNQQRTI